MRPRVHISGVSTRGGAPLRGAYGAARISTRPALSGLLTLLLTSP